MMTRYYLTLPAGIKEVTYELCFKHAVRTAQAGFDTEANDENQEFYYKISCDLCQGELKLQGVI